MTELSRSDKLTASLSDNISIILVHHPVNCVARIFLLLTDEVPKNI